MNYIVLADLKKALGPKETIFTSVMDDDELNAIIIKKSKLIDEYLNGYVTLPEAAEDIPQLFIDIVTALCVFNIYSLNANMDVPKIINDDYKNSFILLEKIRSGKIKLTTETEPTDTTGDIRFKSDLQVLNQDL